MTERQPVELSLSTDSVELKLNKFAMYQISIVLNSVALLVIVVDACRVI